jgi:hypothetical protein
MQQNNEDQGYTKLNYKKTCSKKFNDINLLAKAYIIFM